MQVAAGARPITEVGEFGLIAAVSNLLASSRVRSSGVLLSTGALGPEASISKLYWSEYHQRATRLALDVLGADALAVEGRGPLRSYRTDAHH